VERADGGDPLGRRPFGGVDHDELLHEPLVDRLAVALDDEDVGAPDALQKAAIDLAVGEGRKLHLAQGYAQVLGDLLGEWNIRPPTEEHELLLREQFHNAPSRSRPELHSAPDSAGGAAWAPEGREGRERRRR